MSLGDVALSLSLGALAGTALGIAIVFVAIKMMGDR